MLEYNVGNHSDSTRYIVTPIANMKDEHFKTLYEVFMY